MIGGRKVLSHHKQAWRGALALLGVMVGCSGGASDSVNVGSSESDSANAGTSSPSGVSDRKDPSSHGVSVGTSVGWGGAAVVDELGTAGAGGVTDEVTVTLPGGEQALANQLVIKRSAGITRDALNTGLSAFGAKVVSADDLLSTELGYDTIELPFGMSLESAQQQLGALGLSATAEPVLLVPYEKLPNDPLYGQLWGMPKIHAADAWERTTGARSVLVAIVDTGIDAGHPDLAPNLWRNPGEIAGNGVDDDRNGFVDDMSGWNFVNGTNAPGDDVGHGSHVAGTIGAVGNNGL